MPSKSIWLENAQCRYPQLTGDHEFPVVIVGGGLTGLTCAYYLSKAKVNVAVVEAKTIGSGTSGHTTAHITSQHGLIYDKWIKRFGFNNAKLFADANQQAITNIHDIIQSENIDCDFSWQDSYLFTNEPANVPKIYDEQRAASQLGIDAQMADLSKAPVPCLQALVFKNQAQFNPKKYIDGLAQAILKYGGTIYENSRILHIKDYDVISQQGKIRAENIVIATHNPIINLPGMYFARMYLDRAYVVALENAVNVEGMWTCVDKKGHTYRMYDKYLLLDGEDHRCGTKGKVNHYKRLAEYSKMTFPNSKVKYQWSAQDGMTLDGFPYIGHYSKNSTNMYVATGYGKWGMTKSNVAGNILSDLILKKDNPFAEIFSPQRKFLPISYASAVAINSLVAADYLAGLFTKSPRCAHFKCGLRWNRDEKTWDCPCHGSRFEENGSVLDSPAIHDLKRKR